MSDKETLEHIHSALGGKETAEGFQVHCPCHNDTTASLSVGIGDSGIVVHCKAGCDGSEVWEALKARGLIGRPKTDTAAKLVEIYNYPDGIQKVRFEPKDFRIRRSDPSIPGGYHWQNARKGFAPKLFKLPELKAAIAQGRTILLCEGEKDVKAFLALGIPGYYATTNIEGSSTWRREYTTQLSGARVVICEDNDPAGIARTLKVGEALSGKCSVSVMTFEDCGPKGDLSDLIAAKGKDAVLERISGAAAFDLADYIKKARSPGLSQESEPKAVSALTQPPDISAGPEQSSGRKRVKEATREEYFELFERVLGPLPRDMFSGDCMIRHGKFWRPAENHLSLVKSEAHFLETSRIRKYNMQMIDNHFQDYQFRKEPKLIPDIPEWDGVDRVAGLVRCLELEPEQEAIGIDHAVALEYFKHWFAGIFRKIQDPTYRNIVLIIKGPQWKGKDWLIGTMTSGFDQWAKDLTIGYHDKDMLLQLSSAAVLRIPEFDRMNKADQSTIKDMVTRPYTNIRASYDRKAFDRQCYASFIASCNTEEFYRDPSGHTRYAVINISGIKFEYSRTRDDEKQLLAQAIHLKRSGYEVSADSKQAMAKFLDSKTPESFPDLAREYWLKAVSGWLRGQINSEDVTLIVDRGWITNDEAMSAGLFEIVSKQLSVNQKTVRHFLKIAGLGVRDNNQRGYKIE